MLQVVRRQPKDRAEALSRVKRVPLEEGEELELRRVLEAADFATVMPPEEIAKGQAWRAANEKPVVR